MLTPSPVQTTYNRYINVAQVGMPATMTGWDVSTRIAEDLASPQAGLPFGRVVSQGTLHGDKSACLGVLSGRAVVGITAADKTLPQYVGGTVDAYTDGDNMAVAVRGDWWLQLKAGQTAAAGDPVYFDSTTGEIGGSGISNATLLDGAIFISTAPLDSAALMYAETGQFAVARLTFLFS